MTSRLTLTVLVDNAILTDRYFSAEPGLSFYIETAGRKLLFDTGYSGMFLTNAEKMGISLRDLDDIVLSHGHHDHTGGLVTISRLLMEAKIEDPGNRTPEIVAHTRCFYPKLRDPLDNISSFFSEDEVRRQFPVILSPHPFWITDNLIFLGEIPRIFAFEKTEPEKRVIFMPDGSVEPDFLLDDSAIAYRSQDGLVIITGCSHSGICNITEYARKVCGEERVIDIIGGLHLLNPTEERLQKTGEYLGDLNLHALHACHCTSLAAKIALARTCPVKETGVGMKLGWS